MEPVDFHSDYEEQKKTAEGLLEMVAKMSAINDLKSPATRQPPHVYGAAAWALKLVIENSTTNTELLKEIEALGRVVVDEDVLFFKKKADAMREIMGIPHRK